MNLFVLAALVATATPNPKQTAPLNPSPTPGITIIKERELPVEMGLQKSLDDAQARLAQGEKVLDDLREKYAAAISPERERQELEDSLKKSLDGTGAVVYRNAELVVVRLPGTLFVRGAVKPDGRIAQVLSPIAKQEIAHAGTFDVMVEGNTDATPVRGAARVKDNWQMGFVRASSVAEMLQHLTLRSDGIAIASRGSNLPVSEKGDQGDDRRVEFVFMPKRVSGAKAEQTPTPQPEPTSPKVVTSLDPDGDKLFLTNKETAK